MYNSRYVGRCAHGIWNYGPQAGGSVNCPGHQGRRRGLYGIDVSARNPHVCCGAANVRQSGRRSGLPAGRHAAGVPLHQRLQGAIDLCHVGLSHYHEHLDELRRRKTRAATSLDTLLDSGWSPADEGDVPERHAVASEQRRVLDAAIAELPEDMRSAVVLRDVQGFSYDEISAMLEVNVGTIKSRISRGREKLRQILQENSELFN